MNYKEPLLVLVSQAVAVIVHSLAKYLETTGSVNTLQILQIRMLITLGINSIYLWVRGSTEVWFDTNGIRLLLALRTLGGVCGAAGFYCTNSLCQHLSSLISYLVSKYFSVGDLAEQFFC